MLLILQLMNNQPELQIQEAQITLQHNQRQHSEDKKDRNQFIGTEKIDFLYDIVIQKNIEQTDITTLSQPFKIEVTNRRINKKWHISRNYQDFVWLYNALKMALPGYILPYLPASAVTKYLQQKLIYLNSKERGMYLVSELYQLQNFITNLSQDQIYGFAEQLRIFLLQNNEEYANRKRKIDESIQQLNLTQNTNFSISSLIEKGLNLFSNKPADDHIQFSKEWLEIKVKISTYSTQLYSLVEKISNFKRTKEDEVYWKGPVTEIDSIQRVIVKIESSKPSTQILNAEIQVKLLHPLITECKKEVQLQELIRQKQNLQKLIKHLVQKEEDEQRIDKLKLRKQKFQTHFSQNWQKASANWYSLAQELNQRFQNIYQLYSKNMYKIWK